MGAKVHVIVMPKDSLLDPQGDAVRDALRHLGGADVRRVRVGRFIELEWEGNDPPARDRLDALCRDLLSNPVIEEYSIQPAACPAEDVPGR